MSSTIGQTKVNLVEQVHVSVRRTCLCNVRDRTEKHTLAGDHQSRFSEMKISILAKAVAGKLTKMSLMGGKDARHKKLLPMNPTNIKIS